MEKPLRRDDRPGRHPCRWPTSRWWLLSWQPFLLWVLAVIGVWTPATGQSENVTFVEQVTTVTPTLEVSTVNHHHDTQGFGYETIPREHLDHWNNSIYILHPDDSFVHRGFVHSWHIYANRTVEITFQIWRPTHSTNYENQFRLIGQNSFHIPHLGQHNFVVDKKKRLFFHEGDFIGIYFPQQNPIPFTKPSSNCSRPTLYMHKIGSPRVGRVYAFREHEPGWNPCRLYSIYAEITNNSAGHAVTTPPTTTVLPETTTTQSTTTTIPTTTPAPTEPSVIEVRVGEGRTPAEGLVYVRRPGGEWGTVCDDGWDDQDAAVVCRQRGFSDGRARYPPFFGQGSPELPILLDDLQCNGTELQLADCPRLSRWGRHNCYHREDAGVQCFNHLNETEHVLGFPDVQRSQTDRWMSGIYLPHPTRQLPCSRAVLTDWHFYIQTAASADVALQIWRKKGPLEYMLVGQTEYHSLPPGRYDKTLIGDQRIEVEAGDVLGVQFARFNPVPYDNVAGPCTLEEVGLYAETPTAGVRPGVVHGFVRKTQGASMCRMYSMFATYQVAHQPATWRFSSGTSQYLLVSDLSDTYQQAQRACARLLGSPATLVNITSEQEYAAVSAALHDMDLPETSAFWVGGFVNDPWLAFRRWGHCQPVHGKECVVLGRPEDDFGATEELPFKMSSMKCYESHNFICELAGPDEDDGYGPELLTSRGVTTTAPPSIRRPNHVFNTTLSDVIKRRTIPPGTSAGIISGAVLSVVVTILLLGLLTAFVYRRCKRRLGPNDISESTVRFVSLYDKAPI